ncbi:major facilitator superfamily domain-containing protein [Lasiosphaeria miniovina]|uniref:Major facilitator superfamily domain-containing protein n=1 Tax=Lasiosphaeria miniovina TaxID=1954250 RepID=A0AA40A0C9_9PEZI|nr:major facilitator superfamily domain-containing protein [Lasiosphaeria miniovina]KAK0706947.1 major facilitator superfamily domain-containing protein [Lasiosphaeria miniovina]
MDISQTGNNGNDSQNKPSVPNRQPAMSRQSGISVRSEDWVRLEQSNPTELGEQVEDVQRRESAQDGRSADRGAISARESVQSAENPQSGLSRCRVCSHIVIEDGVNQDAFSRYGDEAAGNGVPYNHHSFSASSTYHEDKEDMILAWEENDPENPYNWSGRRKAGILLTTMMLIVNSTMGSALPSNALPFIMDEWGIVSEQQKVLPISVYLIGYVMGPILWAPLSEQYGRKKLTIGTFIMFTLFTLACALAPDWTAFLVFRLMTGVFASAPIAIVPGIIADTCGDPRTRGRSMGLFFMMTVSGPLLAPIISGYCAPTIGWRWAFWIGLMYAGATLIPLILLPETNGPVLLLRRARDIRAHDPAARVVAPHELEKNSLTDLVAVVLTRPVRMIIFESIVNTSCAYLALCYAIFYMTFEAFPIIFQGVYGLSPGACGLTYLAILAGCLLSLPIFFAYDTILRRAQDRDAPWTRHEEYRRLPLACIGGPMFVISLFWLGWTAREDVPFFVPMLAGIPFGIGFMCIFQALLNYLTDAYEIFAASANAAASCSRSLLATVLPLATVPMFTRLGISGACSLLGGISLLMCAIPFVFLWQGDRIRANSKFCLALRQRKEDMARRIEDQRTRRFRRESEKWSSSLSSAGPRQDAAATAADAAAAASTSSSTFLDGAVGRQQ